ncbi:hypothetical protein QJS04_geneDACA023831 [Acorus gramineus]|uniref:Uncharacterized protein n=1 Tax=Acorus gramineus TaxID=55184 RepID=A0AAV9AN03_ACOGR|nr:hypothetical protein QJS04_geneDACA023831 [Acorus gramineus]
MVEVLEKRNYFERIQPDRSGSGALSQATLEVQEPTNCITGSSNSMSYVPVTMTWALASTLK